MQGLRSHEQIRDVNVRYHDVAAPTYDAKWGIDFGDVGRGQVLHKLRKLLGPEADLGFGEALEIGCGTGYLGLNLLSAGLIEELTCTDISAGMVAALTQNARRLGLSGVHAITADAEALPFADESFDLVCGHAVLHHIPDLARAFEELHRVLRPGGRIVFAGEPSRAGDRLARIPKRAALWLAPGWRALLRAAPASAPAGAKRSLPQPEPDRELERAVDIHAFIPSDLELLATVSGFDQVTVAGEELLANSFGWFNRCLEATADPAEIPMLWRRYAFRGYLLLQRLDERVLEPRLPRSLFYNVLLTGRRR